MIPAKVLESIPRNDRSLVSDLGSAFPFAIKPASEGFSRNRVWHVVQVDAMSDLQYAVRRWDCETYSKQRLQQIADFQNHLLEKKIVVPKPLRWLNNEYVLPAEDALWTIEYWLAGEAIASHETVSDDLLDQIVTTLLALHHAGREWGNLHYESAGIADRIKKIHEWQSRSASNEWQEQFRSQAFGDRSLNRLSEATLSPCEILSPIEIHQIEAAFASSVRFIQQRGASWISTLALIQSRRPECHWVLRDLWRENILIDRGRVCGVIDFGAARVDWPILEVVRALSSFLSPSDPRWQSVWDSYQRQSPTKQLPSFETIQTLDHIATTLSLLYWYDQIVGANSTHNDLKRDPDKNPLTQNAWSRIQELSIRFGQF